MGSMRSKGRVNIWLDEINGEEEMCTDALR